MKAKLVGDLSGVHGIGQILLVGEHQEEGVAQLVLVQHTVKLLTCLRNTLAVIRVNNEDDTLRVLEVYTVAMEEKDEGREDTSDAEDVQCLQRGRILSCPPTSHTL